MKLFKQKMLIFGLTLGLTLSVLSARPGVAKAQPLPRTTEVQTVGGSCAGALGVTAGFAAAALSPCSMLCASFAWYSLLAVAIEC